MSPGGLPRLAAVQSDHRLLALAREGDDRAFEALVRRHRRPLLRYCRRMGLSEARGEDVVQQSLLRAWLALARGAEVHAPKAWLYRTVHNTAVNALRSAREHGSLEDNVLAEVGASAESDFERRMAVRKTLHDVAGLPQMQRDAILLTAFDGRSHEQIAVALGVTHGAVRGLLYRARATLRDAAAALLPPPLLVWAGAVLARVPGATKVAELAAPAGNADVGAALAKGAAVAATAAVLAVGTGVVSLPRHLAHRSRAAAQALGIAPATAEAQTSPSRTPLAGAPRAGTLSGPGLSTHTRRAQGRDALTPPSARGTHADSGSRDGAGDRSGRGAGELTAQRGGEAELAGEFSSEGVRAPRGGSGIDALQAPEGSASEASRPGRSAAECDSCSPAPSAHDEAAHRSDSEPEAAPLAPAAAASPTPPAAGTRTPARSGEPPVERPSRD